MDGLPPNWLRLEAKEVRLVKRTPGPYSDWNPDLNPYYRTTSPESSQMPTMKGLLHQRHTMKPLYESNPICFPKLRRTLKAASREFVSDTEALIGPPISKVPLHQTLTLNLENQAHSVISTGRHWKTTQEKIPI
jgi:hypothetical protein